MDILLDILLKPPQPLMGLFFVQLDRKPDTWENRILLYTAYLINENKKSTTIKSCISAIKAVLADINIKVSEDRYLLNSLTRACKLHKDTFRVRMPIQKDMLNIIIDTTRNHFLESGQVYLARLYTVMFSTAYYGLFRVGELAHSNHSVKACDIHIGLNKNKVLLILRSSKTHGRNIEPQLIKVSSSPTEEGKRLAKHLDHCPYDILRKYLKV